MRRITLRKLLLISTALVGFTALPVRADPLSTMAALLANGVGFGSALTATFGFVGAAVLKIGGSMLLSRLSIALQGKPKQEQQRAELARPTALPAYRYAYGQCWAPGTPLGWQVVGNVLYICYLLNSRASALTTHTVLFDKRACTATGNPFDFTVAGGATATSEPFTGHVKYWIGRGDQTTAPAQIVAEADDFASTDAWRGRTVLWARLDCGANSERGSRWPSTPPELNVEGDWSLVYDPRDGLTKFSRNQALIVLDALRNAPAKPHADSYLRMDTFAWGADVAAQAVAVKAGGTIPRYQADGVLVWAAGAELEDQIQPLLDAGASRLIRIGGQTAFLPAVARAPVHTITDFSDASALVLEKMQPMDVLYTEAEATYTSAARAYESAVAPVFVVPGAQAADGGLPNRAGVQLDFVLDHRQGQRVSKIMAMRSRMQRTIAGELWPDAFDLVAGSVATVDLPAPMIGWNGNYVVEEIDIAAGLNDDQSITLRLPAKLREESAAIYAWDAATEEQDVQDAVFDPFVASVQPPATLTVVSGSTAAIVSGLTITARVRGTWPATVSASATQYEWQWRVGSGPWNAGGLVDITANDAGTYIVHLSPVVIGDTYQFRVRSIGVYGSSGWRESGTVAASGPSATLSTPSIRTATGGAGQVALVLDQADDPDATKIEVWRATVNNVNSASLITTRNAAANVTVSWTNTGLAAGTYYFWARAKDGLGNISAYSAVKSATVT